MIFYILCCIFIFINLFRLRIKDSLTPSFRSLRKHKASVNLIILILENQNNSPKLFFINKKKSMEPERLLGKAYSK